MRLLTLRLIEIYASPHKTNHFNFNFNHDNYKNKEQTLNKFRTGNDTLPKFNRILNDNAKQKMKHKHKIRQNRLT